MKSRNNPEHAGDAGKIMPIRKYTIADPLLHVAGDQYARVGSELRQMRGATVVATRDLSEATKEVLTDSDHIGPSQTTAFYEEFAVATAKTLTNVSVSGAGAIIVTFNDNQVELSGGHADGVAIAEALDANGALAEQILIAKMYRHSPDGTDIGDAIGSSVLVDSQADTPIVYTPSNEMG